MGQGAYYNRVFWITGGGSGIGEALAMEAARRGAWVAVSGRRVEPLERVVAAIEATGARALAVPCDVADDASIRAAVEQIVSAWGKIDAVIANAGFGLTGAIEDLTFDDWSRQLNTNVIGAIMTATHAMPHLRHTRGRIALIGSVAGVVVSPNVGAYSASKAAIRSIAQTLHVELLGTGVSCTLVQPGFVESDINRVDNSNTLREDWTDRRPAWLMWPADRAARVILDALWERDRECTFTRHGQLAAALGQHVPGVVPRVFNGVRLLKKVVGR